MGRVRGFNSRFVIAVFVICILALSVFTGCRLIGNYSDDNGVGPVITESQIPVTLSEVETAIQEAAKKDPEVVWKPEITGFIQGLQENDISTLLGNDDTTDLSANQIQNFVQTDLFKTVETNETTDPDYLFSMDSQDEIYGQYLQTTSIKSNLRNSFYLPTSINWANKDGINYVSSVKSQGRYGTCVAFATTGTLEAHLKIALDDPNFEIDLSEAWLWYFGTGKFPAYNKQKPTPPSPGGWNYGCAFSFLLPRNGYTVSENDAPYNYLNLFPDFGIETEGAKQYQVNGIFRLKSATAMKIALQKGPVAAVMKTNACIFYYGPNSGIYSYIPIFAENGKEIKFPNQPDTTPGAHAIMVVGYDDGQGCWICKNSWGSNWGENGFFRAKYGKSIYEDSGYLISVPVMITSKDPSPQQTDLPVSTSVAIKFGEALRSETVTNDAFSLEKLPGDVPVSISLTYNNGSKTVILKPEEPLEPATSYRVTVNTKVKSADGDSLLANDSWVFYTTGYSEETIEPRAEFAAKPTEISGSAQAKFEIGGYKIEAFKYKLDNGAWSQEFPVSKILDLAALENGPHLLKIVGRNGKVWQEEAKATEWAWKINSEIPAGYFSYGPDAITSDTNPGFCFKADDMTKMKLKLDNYGWSNWINVTNNQWDFYYKKISSPGSHTLQAIACNSLGVVQPFDSAAKWEWSYDPDFNCNAVLLSQPLAESDFATASFQIGGDQIVAYKFLVDSQTTYSDEFPISTLINLTELNAGDHVIKVIGKTGAGVWQDSEKPTTYTWKTIPVKSSEKAFNSFGFTELSVSGSINESDGTITATVPFGTDISALAAEFSVSEKATVEVNKVSQVSGQSTNDFSSVVFYVITAENGSTKEYSVIVTISQPIKISSAVVNIIAPVSGAVPQDASAVEKATSNEDYSISKLTWNETMTTGGKFKAGQVYTADITLTSKNGKMFQIEAFNPTVAGSASVGTTTTTGSDIGNSVTFTVTYDSTGALTITSIAVTTQPTKLSYAEATDGTLALNGMVVTETNNDGSTNTVTFADGTASGYTTTPSNGVTLTNAANNGKPVVITHTASAKTANTSNLAVSAIGEIAAAAVTIATPVLGKTPQDAVAVQTATNNADYTVTALTWNEALTAGGKFKAAQVYTATVTLTSKNNKKFQTTAFTPTVSGSASVGTTTTTGTAIGNTVTFTVTYASTDALAVTSIAVTTQPTKLSYAEATDGTLALNGMAVTETNNDGSTNTVTFTDGTAAGYTANPANGIALTNATNNAQPVVVTHTASGKTANTSNLTVSAIVEITAAAVAITAPVLGVAPQNAAAVEAATANADYTVTALTWNEALTAGGKFKAGQAYTATVTLTSKNGKKFQAAAFTPTVSGSASVGTTTTTGSDIGNSVTFTVTYNSTGALAVTSIAVTTQPTKLIYVEATDGILALNGMVVTETNNDGSTNTVTFTNGTASGYTTSPANGATLTNAANNAQAVVVTHTASNKTANTNSLTVTATPVITAPTSVTLSPVGGNIVANLLNTTNTNLTAQATIVAGEATGGEAELLKDGNSFSPAIKDTSIAAGDTTVTFDFGSADNSTLQSKISSGGVFTVRLKDAAGNSSVSSVGNPTLSVSYSAPVVQNVTSAISNGGYSLNQVIDITVKFSKSVQVTTTGGTPGLTMETGNIDRVAAYQSGDGTDTLTFRYTVQNGDLSTDLDYSSTSALSLNGGTILDSDKNPANLTLANPGSAGSLGANKALIINAVTNYSFSGRLGEGRTGWWSGERRIGKINDVAVDSSGNIYATNKDLNKVLKFSSTGDLITSWGGTGSTDGKFNNPFGIEIDSSGNVYVADTENYRIQKFDANGGFITKWGTQGSSDGQFNKAQGIGIDSSDNIYVADTHNHRIQKFTSSGSFTTKWGFGPSSADNAFSYPCDVAIDSSGNIYVADLNNNRILKFSAPGVFVAKWVSPTLSSGQGDNEFFSPSSITIDSSNNVYIADTSNNRIKKHNTSGAFIAKWGVNGVNNGEFSSPYGIALDSAGNVYVADTNNMRIQKFNSSGSFLSKYGPAGDKDSQFFEPKGVAVDSSGNIYVADKRNHRIQKFDSNGSLLTKWGSGEGSANGQLSYPKGVAVDGSGNVYVADTSNHRIQKFTSSGGYLLQWGSYGSSNGQFHYPTGIAIDSSGNVYVADDYNHRIQKFSSSGGFLANYGSPGSGDGQFDNPKGIAIDSQGYIYVADTDNQRIQKFTSSMSFVTKWGTTGSADGQFNYPQGIAIDKAGNVYVSDSSNQRIQKFTTSGTFLAKWGTSGINDGELLMPFGIAIDNSGNIIVADLYTHSIEKFTP